MYVENTTEIKQKKGTEKRINDTSSKDFIKLISFTLYHIKRAAKWTYICKSMHIHMYVWIYMNVPQESVVIIQNLWILLKEITYKSWINEGSILCSSMARTNLGKIYQKCFNLSGILKSFIFLSRSGWERLWKPRWLMRWQRPWEAVGVLSVSTRCGWCVWMFI